MPFVRRRSVSCACVLSLLREHVLLCALSAGLAAPSLALADPVLTAPEVIFSVKAAYPSLALADRTEAVVVVLATVGADGTVTEVKTVESGGAEFDRAAQAAARKWRFRPALSDKTPIESEVRIPFHFHLAGG